MAGGATTLDISVTDDPPPQARDIILNGLRAFNLAQAGIAGRRPLAVLVQEHEGLVGGLLGYTSHGWLSVELLYVPEALRGAGLGGAILRHAEDEAIRRDCGGARLDTFSFQSRGFYERLGYTVFGTLEDYPPGHSRFFLQKRLSGAAPDPLSDS